MTYDVQLVGILDRLKHLKAYLTPVEQRCESIAERIGIRDSFMTCGNLGSDGHIRRQQAFLQMQAHVLKCDVVIFVVTQHVSTRVFSGFNVLPLTFYHKRILGAVTKVISEDIPYIIWSLLVERYDAKLFVG